jgi:hypothetical protein
MPIWNVGAGGGSSGDVTISGLLNPIMDELTILSNGQISFTLSESPYDSNDLSIYLNGLKQDVNDYGVTGTTLSWLGDYNLETDDYFVAFYFVSA